MSRKRTANLSLAEIRKYCWSYRILGGRCLKIDGGIAALDGIDLIEMSFV